MNIDIIIAAILVASFALNAFIARWQLRQGLAPYMLFGARLMSHTWPGRMTIALTFALQIILFNHFAMPLSLTVTLLTPIYSVVFYMIIHRAARGVARAPIGGF